MFSTPAMVTFASRLPAVDSACSTGLSKLSLCTQITFGCSREVARPLLSAISGSLINAAKRLLAVVGDTGCATPAAVNGKQENSSAKRQKTDIGGQLGRLG